VPNIFFPGSYDGVVYSCPLSPMRCFSLFLLLLPPALLLGCGSSDAPDGPSPVTDDLGRTVRLERPVERVVSLAPNLTELAFAAGGGNRLVAVTSSADHPPATDTIDRVGALPVDFEAVTAKRPDLVLATDQVNPPGDSETFGALDIPVYFFSFTSLDDVFSAVETMGRLFGTEATARDTVQALRQRVQALQRRTDGLSAAERPRVLVLIGDKTLYSFGKDSYVHTLVHLAGGRSVTDSLDASAPTLSDEYVLTEKPDVIVGAWGTDYDPDRLLELHPGWDVVPAVRNGRVYSLPADLLLRPGPRLVEGAWRMADRLHPDRVASGAAPPDSVSSAPDTAATAP